MMSLKMFRPTRLTGVIVLLTAINTAANAQQSAVTAGGHASGTNGSVSYSIGQISNSSATGSSGTINEGVQQPYEFFPLEVNAYSNINLSCKLYPNPVVSKLFLNVDGMLNESLGYDLFDIQGKLIRKGLVLSASTEIEMSDLSSGSYILKVHDDLSALKTFKVIKNQ